jgi:hypothetical protein
MKKIVAVIALLIICGLVIGAAVKSGMHHGNCSECKIVCKESVGLKKEDYAKVKE